MADTSTQDEKALSTFDAWDTKVWCAPLAYGTVYATCFIQFCYHCQISSLGSRVQKIEPLDNY